MGKMLDALHQLQTIERQLAHVRDRLKTRRSAVASQERRIEQFRADWQGLHDKGLTRRKDADRLELDLKGREDQVSRLRGQLNTVKTNKEYAAILTQINTLKADNARIEEEALKIMQEVDAIKAEAEKVDVQIETEQKRLGEIQQNNAEEIKRLDAMMQELTAQRTEAAKAVPSEALASFDRIASSYDGNAMAVIEVQGKKPPYEYTCGGCFMSLNAEHANALRTRDEIRHCDNCGRILYMEGAESQAKT